MGDQWKHMENYDEIMAKRAKPMNDVVERLAEKGCEYFHDTDMEGFRADARWWLNAIADELEAESARISDRLGVRQGRHTHHMALTVRWIREQAKP